MAAATRDVKKELSNIVDCSICCETYDDPRQLPCIHSFCLKCMKEYCMDKNPGDAVACPLCRKVFSIPPQGVVGLPKNFLMEQLKELAGPSNIHCDVCNRSAAKAAMKKVATKFCVDCSEKLCETCAEIHGKMRATMGHHLVELNENEEPSKSRVRLTRVNCDKHPEKVLELFCFDCKTAICMMCFIQSHQIHKCSEIYKVYEFHKQMTVDIKNMVDAVNRCREIVEVERKKKVKFNNKVKELEREICDRADRLKQLIDEDKSNLLKELKSFEVERNKQVNYAVEEIEQHISFVESLRTYTEQIRDKGGSGDVTQQRCTLQDRANELLKLDSIQRAINELGSFDVTFIAATWPTSNRDIVGKISKKHVAGRSSDQVAVDISTSSPVQRPQDTTVKPIPDKSSGSGQVLHLQPTAPDIEDSSAGTVIPGVSTTSQVERYQQLVERVAETSLSHVISAGDRGAVDGVTVWNEKLFVLQIKSEQKIKQFNVKTFQELKSIAVKGLSDVDYWGKSLTLCNINNCMYICDCYKVFRVDLSTENVISWPVDGCPRGLSVNGTRNVLVTCYNDHSIKEFSSRGSFVRSIKLQVTRVKNPYHCIQLTDGRYVVSHGLPVYGVSEIDEHGTLFATYRNSQTTKLEMKCPRHIILFNNSLLVADVWNHRILLLNSSLSDARPLSLPVNSQLSRPRCVYLEESRGRLFVGEESGRVLVFDNIKANY